jgi:hypothetical protein
MTPADAVRQSSTQALNRELNLLCYNRVRDEGLVNGLAWSVQCGSTKGDAVPTGERADYCVQRSFSISKGF